MGTVTFPNGTVALHLLQWPPLTLLPPHFADTAGPIRFAPLPMEDRVAAVPASPPPEIQRK